MLTRLCNFVWESAPRLAGWGVAGVAFAVVVAWLVGWNGSIFVVDDGAPMSLDAAVCFLLLGLALAACPGHHRTWRDAAALIALALAAGNLAEHIAPGRLPLAGLLTLAVRGAYIQAVGAIPPNAAVAMVIAAMTLLLLGRREAATRWAVMLLAPAVTGIGAAALLGYVLRTASTPAVGSYPAMSFHGSLCLVALGGGMAVAGWRHEQGWLGWTRLMLTGGALTFTVLLVSAVALPREAHVEPLFPLTVFLLGVVFSLLVALTVGSVSIARKRDRDARALDLVLCNEMSRRRRTEEVRDRLVAMLEASSDLVATSDSSGRLRYLNKAARIALGLPKWGDLPPLSLQGVHPLPVAEMLTRTAGALAEDGSLHGETVWNGAAGPIPVSYVLVRHPSGRDGERYFSLIYRDIGEYRRAEAELLRLNASLRQSNRDLEDFASMASHDLQEPLRKIAAFAGRLRSDAGEELSAPAVQCLERIDSAVARMTALIESLLQYARVATRPNPPERVGLRSIVDEVLLDLDHRISSEGAEVTVGPLPEVEADPVQLRELVLNLVANALKFHRPGAIPRVAIEGACVEGAVELRVRDRGVGFDPKYAERIFRPFQRLHGNSEFQGSGMGLAICRKIAERHRGTITALGRPGEGAEFVVTLPRPPEGSMECRNQNEKASASSLRKTMTTTTS